MSIRYAMAEGDLLLEVDQGKYFPMSQQVVDILVANPDIADIHVTSSNDLFVFAKKPGQTHVMAIAAGRQVVFDRRVTVSRNVRPLAMALATQFSDSNLEIVPTPGRILLSGTVPSIADANHILSVAKGVLGEGEEIVNRLEIASPSQVNIRVRMVEVNREATKNLGINWDVLLNPGSLAIGIVTGRLQGFADGILSTDRSFSGRGSAAMLGYQGDNGSATAIIDALAEEDLLTILAEPNLTSRSGETARFFAGGEFPIPISSGDEQVTVSFKKFGVILEITPTVLANGKIDMHIRPEVSEISEAGAVVINNFSIPGISVRRTEATIELNDGQSFAVAGLLQNQTRNLINEVPWLSELAVLGPLFRSTRYRNSETELVIIATAHIVEPVQADTYSSPADGYRPASLIEKLSTGRLAEPPVEAEFPIIVGPGGLKLIGPAGYFY
ncbi:MAG: type II and III secretion system protein family protein [Proteobacteria bacterium]|nr:type II and III secretion system protein family protein [Pseudomonadota bacterium]